MPRLFVAIALLAITGCSTAPPARRCASGPMGESCRCSAGNGKSCMMAAAQLENASQPNLSKALSLYRKACDLNVSAGCETVVNWIYYGRGTNRSWVGAAATARQFCVERRQLACCTQAGLLFLRGQGVTRNTKQGAALLQRACDGKHAEACRILGSALAKGKLLPRNAPRAVKLLQKGCEYGSPRACAVLGVAYVFGSGVPANRNLGLALLERACRAREASACAVLAKLPKR